MQVDRTNRVGTYGYGLRNRGRVHVSKSKLGWRVAKGDEVLKSGLTFAEAIDYAQKKARQ